MAIGESYISRLPDHRGFFLVPVDDAIHTTPPSRPRHTVVVVIDGLRRDFAAKMHSVEKLRAAGQCRTSDVGPISVSRPVYAVISTGLEQDRTGSRNNDETSPLAAESIWEVARDAQLEVSGVSELPWWEQLFPKGFSRYDSKALPLVDLNLWHPLYVDSAGHDAGARSQAYADAAARADRELSALLDELDLAQDLVLLTADHGHSELGGHGGPDPEIREVLSCFAGRGVAHVEGDAAPIPSRTLAPALAVLLGVRFPKHMRALEDDLDQIFGIADANAFTPEYLQDRRAAIAHFRDANKQAIAAWLGHEGSWSDLYARERTKQIARGAVFAIAALALFAFVERKRKPLFLIAWMGSIALLTVALHIVVRGSFDWTAINVREGYIRAASILCAAVGFAAIALHALIHRDLAKLVRDQLTLVFVAIALDLLPPIAFGWHLGFPLPGPTFLLYPFIGSIFLAVHALLALVLIIAAAVAQRWR